MTPWLIIAAGAVVFLGAWWLIERGAKALIRATFGEGWL